MKLRTVNVKCLANMYTNAHHLILTNNDFTGFVYELLGQHTVYKTEKKKKKKKKKNQFSLFFTTLSASAAEDHMHVGANSRDISREVWRRKLGMSAFEGFGGKPLVEQTHKTGTGVRTGISDP